LPSLAAAKASLLLTSTILLLQTMKNRLPIKINPFFPADHTHTHIDGAKLNAEIVVNELKDVKPKNLKKYFL
jgi:hypothetical protein